MLRDRIKLLSDMRKALKRMEADGATEESCEDYSNFKRKYNAISRGADFTIRNVAPEMIAAFAAQIPRANKGTNGWMHPRGDVEQVVKNASSITKELEAKK